MSVPEIRFEACNAQEVRPDRDMVVYWMTAQRRTTYNFALDRAIEWARQLGKPLLIFEPLRLGYQWSSQRLHRFVMDGMCDHLSACQEHDVAYYPYLEPERGADKGLLAQIAQRACVLVTDDYPCFFLPRMLASAAASVDVLMEKVDSNGILPLRAAPKTYTTAYSFRRGLHKLLPEHLEQRPQARPLEGLGLPALPPEVLAPVLKRWPAASAEALAYGNLEALEGMDFEFDVAPSPVRGGQVAAAQRLEDFAQHDLDAYHTKRNDPVHDGSSRLSPYLHFGHLSAHHAFEVVIKREDWSVERLPKATGKRNGWWQVGEGSESFLDELITWREIGYNMSHREPHAYTEYESLPQWARTTLEEHISDEREYLYTEEAFEAAQTHDELWNAAQMELVRHGSIHNYLRMLWGKKILEWTPDPKTALEIMTHLNNKYALDGRDPNSYSGIFWCLGRYDRGWTEREVFGKIRFMSSASTKRKYKVKEYIAMHQPPSEQRELL